ncbi:MAG: hypothetical protein NTX24_00975 [Candidatus Pacearchaeota archaeon]|nr:hypothetical protein [Candidatus Pacearchaeota archaeon]
MTETCKTCREQFDSGVWLVPQFNDEKDLLFCSKKKCKKGYIKMKLERIKWNYPDYYQKIIKHKKEKGVISFSLGRIEKR